MGEDAASAPVCACAKLGFWLQLFGSRIFASAPPPVSPTNPHRQSKPIPTSITCRHCTPTWRKIHTSRRRALSSSCAEGHTVQPWLQCLEHGSTCEPWPAHEVTFSKRRQTHGLPYCPPSSHNVWPHRMAFPSPPSQLRAWNPRAFFPGVFHLETVRAPRGLPQPPPHLETLDSKSSDANRAPHCSHRAGLPSLPSSLRDPDSPPCLPCVYKVRSTGRGANLHQTASNNTAFPLAPRPATLSGHIVWPFPPRFPSSGLGTLVHFFPVFSTRKLCGLRAACPNHPRTLKHWTRKSSDANRAPRCSQRAGLPSLPPRLRDPDCPPGLPCVCKERSTAQEGGRSLVGDCDVGAGG